MRGRLWQLIKRLCASLLAGALFLALLVGAVGLGLSLSERHPSPKAAAKPLTGADDTHWFYKPESQSKISELEVRRMHEVDGLWALHMSVSWTLEWHGQRQACQDDILVQEYADIFGGWRTLGRMGIACGESSVQPASPRYIYWNSLPLELPRAYHFYTVGRHSRAAQVEAVLEDGGGERVDVVDGAYVLWLRRDAPFRVKWLQFIDADGEPFTHRRIGNR